ncbi:MAG: glycosyltransferase family 8 protein [Verrucomicrobiales bacterium]|nr:glycosyltransferase family 8 protein [Verrucomicrobiales bacterium]
MPRHSERNDAQRNEVEESLLSSAAPPLAPAFEKNNVAVVFAADGGYGKYLLVTLTSLAAHAAPENNYDLVILDGGLSATSKQFISRLARENISIRYCDIGAFMQAHAGAFPLTVSHITLATYYRFFIPQILPDYEKIVYLDSDLILDGDVAELFNFDLRGKMLAAVRDPYPVIFNDRVTFADYVRDTLKLENAEDYFNAGVLLMNVRRMVAEHFTEQCVECATRLYKVLKFVDQCVLNALFADNEVTPLPDKFNAMWQYILPVHRQRIISPEALLAYRKIYDDAPLITHYTTFRKPWNFMPSDSGNWPGTERWWKYARLTPCYEFFLSRIIKMQAPTAVNQKIKLFGTLTVLRVKREKQKLKIYLLNFIPFISVIKTSFIKRHVALFGVPLITIKN